MLLLYEYLLPRLLCTCIMVFVCGIRLQSYRLRQFNQHVFAHQNMRSTDSKPFFITAFFTLPFISLEIKNCKYKYIFNILVSSIKILKIPGLKKNSFQKSIGSPSDLQFFTQPLSLSKIYQKQKMYWKNLFFFHYKNVNCDSNTDPPHHSLPLARCHRQLQKMQAQGGPSPPAHSVGPPQACLDCKK